MNAFLGIVFIFLSFLGIRFIIKNKCLSKKAFYKYILIIILYIIMGIIFFIYDNHELIPLSSIVALITLAIAIGINKN